MVTGQAPQTAHTYPLDDVLGRHAHHNPQCQLILLGASADSIHGGHVWGWSSEAVLARAEPPGLAMHSWRQILLWMTAAPAAQQILCSLQVSSSTLPPHTPPYPSPSPSASSSITPTCIPQAGAEGMAKGETQGAPW